MKKVVINEKGQVESAPIADSVGSFSDHYDIARLSVDVDPAIREELGKDYVLAYLDPAQREFIIEQVAVAEALWRITPDRKTAMAIARTIMIRNHSIVVLHRNLEKNPLLQLLLRPNPEEEEKLEEQDDKLKNKLSSLFTSKEKKQV